MGGIGTKFGIKPKGGQGSGASQCILSRKRTKTISSKNNRMIKEI